MANEITPSDNICYQTEEDIDLMIMCNMMQENYECRYFKNTYADKQNDSKFINKLYSYFTSYIRGSFDSNHISLFLTYNLDNDDIFDKFLSGWYNYLENNHDSKENYNILTSLLANIKRLTKNQFKSKAIMTNKIWSSPYFRKLINHAPQMKTGCKYLSDGIFSSLFELEKWHDNIDIVVDALKPFVRDESVHCDLVKYIWNIFNVNSAYTKNNDAVIKKHDCSPIYFTTMLLQLLLNIFDYYGYQKIETQIKSCEFNEVKDYDISKLSFFGKLYVTLLYGIAVSMIPSFRRHSELSNQSPIVLLNNNLPNDIVANRLEKLITSPHETIQKVYCLYGSVYKYVTMNEVFNDILMYVEGYMVYLERPYETTDIIGDKIIQNINQELLVLVSDIAGGMASNKHMRYFAAEIILTLVPVIGYMVFDKTIKSSDSLTETRTSVDSILENMFNYLNDVDFFKWSVVGRTIEHHKNIQELLIMLLDDIPKGILVSDRLDKNIAGTLFNLIKISFDMFKKMDGLVDSITTARIGLHINVAFLPTNIKLTCESLMNLVMQTLVIAKSIFEKKLIHKIHPELERELSIFIINNIEKLSVGTHILYTRIKNPSIAGNILKLTYEVLANHLTVDIMPYLVDHIDVIINGVKNIKFDYVTDSMIDQNINKNKKESITEFLLSYHAENDDIDWPYEFIDPISCCVVENPVMLSGSNDIYDRTTIITHIQHDAINPYSKEPLTEDILDKYNELSDIKAKIEDFKLRKQKFISDHKENKKIVEILQ